jgi:hypothetical protein
MSQIPQPPQTQPLNAPPAENPLPHSPANDREEVYYEGTPLVRGRLGHVVGFTLLGLVFIVLPILGRAHMKWNISIWVLLACVLIGAALIAMPMFLVKRTRYRVTNYRIDYERGWLSTSIDTIELWHVEDIKFHQTLWDKIVGAGDIEVFAHDSVNPKLFLTDLPHARKLFTTLEQRIISVKRQAGVLKVDTGKAI